jgi:hypothetical protein
MFKILKLLYQFLKEKTLSSFDFIVGRRSKKHNFSMDFFKNLSNSESTNDKSNDFINRAARALVGRQLDDYLTSLKPAHPLLNYDPAIKTMEIEWNTSYCGRDQPFEIKERLEEQIINKYVRYVSRYIFVLLQPNKHKILLNARVSSQLGSFQIPVGEQVVYKDPQQLENYLIDHLMGILVSYQANGMEDFTYFISNIDEQLYKELFIKIKTLFKH